MTCQIPEQHQQGAMKRSREAERDDIAKKQKVDSDDSSGDSDNEDEVDAGRRKEADYSESCMIQSVLRRGQNPRDRTGGSFMRAQLDGSEKTAKLDFTAINPYDSSSVFHLEKNDDEELVHVLRFTDKAKGDNYYLRVYRDSRVKLRKLVNYPTNDKYLFHMKSISCVIGCPVTFQSKQTGEYLSCNDEGEASMLKETITDGKGEPKDRRTWFCCQSDENPALGF